MNIKMVSELGAKKVSFTAYHSGKPVAIMYKPKSHFNQPQKRFDTQD